METPERHLRDLADIRKMMERSSRFISLSGWSGIIAGITALLGYWIVRGYLQRTGEDAEPRFLVGAGLAVLAMAFSATLLFSSRKAKKQGERLWSPVTRKLAGTMLIPLVTGGILCLVFILREEYHLVSSTMLVFYGMGLVNTGRFTNREGVLLGISEIVLGIAALIWHPFSLHFWAAGFGLLHIVYGITIYFRYERQPDAVISS